MLPSFFDSVLQLIVRTSTDLPPDVRAAMKTALGAEPAGTRAVAGADDHRAEHRSRRRPRRRDLPGHRHADLRGQGAGRRQPDLDARSRSARRSPRRRGAASCGRTRSIRSPARTPATTSDPARRSSTSISGSATTIEIKLILKGGGCENTNAQYSLPVELPHLGRADRTLDGVQQVHPARGLERAGQGLQPGRRRRLRRRRSHVRLPARQGAAVPHARRREPGSAAGGARSVDHGDGQQPRDRHDGLRRQGDADRLQDRRAQPAAGELLRLGRLRLLGVPPARRRARRADRRDRRSWLYRDPSHPIIPMLDQAGFARTGREVALHAPLTDEAASAR